MSIEIQSFKTPFTCLVLGAAFGSAQAGCEPVIVAYDKADAGQRYAIYEVDSFAQAPKGEAFTVAIGDVEYLAKYERKGPLNIVRAGFTKGGHAAGVEGRAIREREKKGSLRCEPLGERKLGNEAVVGYRIRDNQTNGPDLAAIEFWIGRASGLPVFHAIGDSDSGGFRWVYGSSVVAPAMGTAK